MMAGEESGSPLDLWWLSFVVSIDKIGHISNMLVRMVL
jgi:hypothetical protein